MATTVVRVEGDHFVSGTSAAGTTSLSAGCVTNDKVLKVVGDGIDADKLQHQYQKVYAQESDTFAADEDRVIHVVHGAVGAIIEFQAGSVVAATGTDVVTVDLHKDGVSVLTAAITLDNTNAAYTPESGTIDTAAVAVTDVLEVVIDATAGDGTLPKGVYCSLQIREDAD